MAGDDERPLLLRDDLKVAALRAAVAAAGLFAWLVVRDIPVRARARLPLILAVTLGLVVFASALVDRLGRRRGWPALRTTLLVAWVGLVGAYGALLQAQATGLTVLDGTGEAALARELGRIRLRALHRVLSFPASVGLLLALTAAFLELAWRRRLGLPWRAALGLAATPVTFAGLLLLASWFGAGVVDPPFVVLLPPAVIGGALLVERGWPIARPATRSRRSAGDLALVASVALVFAVPAVGRFLDEVRRANARSEAERRLEAALAEPDVVEALAHLDASIALRDDPRARLERARRRVALGRRAEADEDLEAAALRLIGDDADAVMRLEALVERGDLLLTDYDRALTAIGAYAKAIAALDAEPALALEHGTLLRRALAGRAAAHAAILDDALADRDASRLVDESFRSAGAWLRRGLTRAVTVRRDAAREDVLRAAEGGSPEACLWLAAVWGERGAAFDALAGRSDWLGAAARALADDVAPDEHALLVAATQAGDAALATALAWLGAQAERTGDASRATQRYQAAMQACARASGTTAARPAPGTHLGGLWAFRRLAGR